MSIHTTKFTIKVGINQLKLGMTKILSARSIIDSKIENLLAESQKLSSAGLKPKLSVILVGNNPASLSYIKNKERFCKRIEADFELVNFPENIEESEFLQKVEQLNSDPKVTGCFVQLPVPKQLAGIDITQLINPKKDVDGFHLNTANNLYLGRLDDIIPCTPKGIVSMLRENGIEIEGKDIVIIGRSHIVGKPLALLLQALNATVTLCHSRTKNLKKHTLLADIIIPATGISHLITTDFVRHDKTQVIIDVGMNKLDARLVGDVDYENVSPLVQAISPVPGGVGPMTVFSLMENLLKTTKNILQGSL